MNLKSCNNCGLVYDINKVTLPTQEQIKDAVEESQGNGVCEWYGDDFYPVFKCRCGTIISTMRK